MKLGIGSALRGCIGSLALGLCVSMTGLTGCASGEKEKSDELGAEEGEDGAKKDKKDKKDKKHAKKGKKKKAAADK